MYKLLKTIYTISNKLFTGKGLGGSYPVQVAYNFVTKRIKKDHAIVKGHKMQLDKYDSLSLSINPGFEEYETSLVENWVKEGDTVLDIGANIGYYTLIFAKLVGKKGTVYAFEPEPTNFKILENNVKTNGYKNVALANKAVMDKAGSVEFFLSNDNCGDNRIFRREASEDVIRVEGISIDRYLKGKSKKVDFIKMDIQGAEGLAIKGMKNVLTKNHNIQIITEFWPYALTETNQDPRQLLEYFKKLGFKIYNVDEKTKTTKEIGIDALLKAFPVKKKKFANLYIKR